MLELSSITREKQIPFEVKKVIFNTVLKPTLMYGSRSCVLRAVDRGRIQAAEMRPLRAVVGGTRRDRVRC